MKIQELIEELKAFKPDLDVKVSDKAKKFYNLDISIVKSMPGSTEFSRSPWVVIEINADPG